LEKSILRKSFCQWLRQTNDNKGSCKLQTVPKIIQETTHLRMRFPQRFACQQKKQMAITAQCRKSM